jgi:transposase
LANIQYVKRHLVVIPMDCEQPVIIKFLANDGLGAEEIAEELRALFAEGAFSSRTAQFWIAGVKRGREDLHDERRSGRPAAADLTCTIQE